MRWDLVPDFVVHHVVLAVSGILWFYIETRGWTQWISGGIRLITQWRFVYNVQVWVWRKRNQVGLFFRGFIRGGFHTCLDVDQRTVLSRSSSRVYFFQCRYSEILGLRGIGAKIQADLWVARCWCWGQICLQNRTAQKDWEIRDDDF